MSNVSFEIRIMPNQTKYLDLDGNFCYVPARGIVGCIVINGQDGNGHAISVFKEEKAELIREKMTAMFEDIIAECEKSIEILNDKRK